MESEGPVIDQCDVCGGEHIEMSYNGRSFLVCANCGKSVEVIDVEPFNYKEAE